MKSSCHEKDDIVCSLSPSGTSHLGRDLTSARGITHQSAESARRIDHSVKEGSFLITMLSRQSVSLSEEKVANIHFNSAPLKDYSEFNKKEEQQCEE